MISTLKTFLVVVAVCVVGIGVLFATGAVKLHRRSQSSVAHSDAVARSRVAAAVASLPYIGAISETTASRGKHGVTLHDKQLAYPGLNVSNPNGWGAGAKGAPVDAPWREARLVDMQGQTLHVWRSKAFGELKRGWAIARIDDEASAYAVVADTGLVKVDWQGETVWSLAGVYHHDLHLLPDRGVLALAERKRVIVRGPRPFPILEHGLAFISPEGKTRRVLWFYEIFKSHPALAKSLVGARARILRLRSKTAGGAGWASDIFHANAVEVMNRAQPGLWEVGDLMVSLRHMNLVAVLSRHDGRLLWSYSQDLEAQHDPTSLANGNVLIFDNGATRKWSRVIEVDPQTKEVVWHYTPRGKEEFYSNGRGLAQRFPNGNTMVVSSNEGRAFEITPEGEVVWEYWPDYEYNGRRVPFRMHRLEGAAARAVLQRIGADAVDEHAYTEPAQQ